MNIQVASSEDLGHATDRPWPRPELSCEPASHYTLDHQARPPFELSQPPKGRRQTRIVGQCAKGGGFSPDGRYISCRAPQLEYRPVILKEYLGLNAFTDLDETVGAAHLSWSSRQLRPPGGRQLRISLGRVGR
jgi:hypothetical protein